MTVQTSTIQTNTQAGTTQPTAQPVQGTLPNFAAMSPQQLTSGAVKFIQSQQQTGKTMAQIVPTLSSWGITLNSDGTASYKAPGTSADGEDSQPTGFFGKELNSIKNIPSAIKGDLQNLSNDRSQEGAPYDVPKDMQSGSDSAFPNKDQLSKDKQETEALKQRANRQQLARDIGAAKDITSAEAAAPNGVLGPIFGMLPSVNPINGKVGTLNEIYSSPEMKQNAQDMEKNWEQITAKHPEVGKIISNSVGIANNVLQIYAGLQGASDVAGFSKGVMDSMGDSGTPGFQRPTKVTMDSQPPEGGNPPPSAPDGVSDMKSYQKGKAFAEMLKNGKLPSISPEENPLKIVRNKIVSKTPASEVAASELPNTPEVTDRLAKASRAFINDPKNAGAAQTEGGKLLDEANQSLNDQIKAGQKLKDEALDGNGYKKVDTKSTQDLFETLLNNNLKTTMEPSVGSLEGKTFEQSVSELENMIENQGKVDVEGKIGKTPFSSTPNERSIIENDKPAQKLLGTVKLTLESIADGKNSASEISSSVRNLQNLISKYYAEGAKNTPAVSVVKQVITDLDKKVADVVPGYKAGKLMQSKAYTFQDLIKEMKGKDAVNAALDKDQPLVVTDPKSPYKGMSVQDATGVNFSQRASIAKMFDMVEDKQNATGGLGIRGNPMNSMGALRTLLPKIERYFNNPEALKAALDDIYAKSNKK